MVADLRKKQENQWFSENRIDKYRFVELFMAADLREMQENQGFSENRIDKSEFI